MASSAVLSTVTMTRCSCTGAGVGTGVGFGVGSGVGSAVGAGVGVGAAVGDGVGSGFSSTPQAPSVRQNAASNTMAILFFIVSILSGQSG